ncbi:MAG: hypothetical protein JO142_16840 [Burkholderiales bacterium]|nr:hypothetical protein [Burkholderiales bacterium]
MYIGRILSLSAFVIVSMFAHAANNPPPGGDVNRVPPREAFEACDGKQAGDKVTFTTPRGETLTGACKMIPARLAAVPDHPPQGGSGNGRPPQAPGNGAPPNGNPPK